jgi:hypothetical protein
MKTYNVSRMMRSLSWVRNVRRLHLTTNQSNQHESSTYFDFSINNPFLKGTLIFCLYVLFPTHKIPAALAVPPHVQLSRTIRKNAILMLSFQLAHPFQIQAQFLECTNPMSFEDNSSCFGTYSNDLINLNYSTFFLL